MKTITYGICALAALLGLSQAGSRKCHAIALSGGANKGAYEIGVMQGLTKLLAPEEVAWDVATGVSAGSINSAGMSMFPVGKEKEMTNFLSDVL